MAASAGRCDLVCLRHSHTAAQAEPPIIIIIEMETIIIDAIIIIIIIFKISTSSHNRQHLDCQYPELRFVTTVATGGHVKFAPIV